MLLYRCIGMFFLSWLCSCQTSTNTRIIQSTNPSPLCTDTIDIGVASTKMNGMSLVAPPNPYQEDPTAGPQAIGSNWVALLPYAYYRRNQPEIRVFTGGGWWGERPVGIATAARYAQQRGMKVMLKPQLWTHNQWIGDLTFETEEDWGAFETNYRRFMMGWAKIADSLAVDLLCIGTEINHAVEKRPRYWRQLIKDIRTIYKGQLTYAPNWDSYENVPFWDALDYIGIDAYFPLIDTDTPTVCALKEAWKPRVAQLSAFAKKHQKKLLFTEYGYLSVDGTAYNTWELEAKKAQLAVNEQAQANAIQALLETFASQDWWAGGFLWKWYPSQSAAIGEGSWMRDYTPQGKQAAVVLKALQTQR